MQVPRKGQIFKEMFAGKRAYFLVISKTKDVLLAIRLIDQFETDNGKVSWIRPGDYSTFELIERHVITFEEYKEQTC